MSVTPDSEDWPTTEIRRIPESAPPARARIDAPLTAATVFGSGPRSGRLEFLAGLLRWRERRFARRVSRELLQLYRIVSAAQPRLKGRELYRRIIMARSRADVEAADALIGRAEQSFASWPVSREVKFGDIVHFVVVSEFFASHGDSPWIHADVGREVASEIPDNL